MQAERLHRRGHRVRGQPGRPGEGRGRHRRHPAPRARRVDARAVDRERRLRPLPGAVPRRPHRGLRGARRLATPASTSASRATSSSAATGARATWPASRSRTRPTPTSTRTWPPHNAGGILVFNLPGPAGAGRPPHARLQQSDRREQHARTSRIAGSSVSGVPTGTGSMVLANDEVEFSGNTFRDNNTTHISVISYNTAQFFGQEPANNPNFDPYSETVFIHDNTFIGGGTDAGGAGSRRSSTSSARRCPTSSTTATSTPRAWSRARCPDALRLCIQQPGATFANLDIPNGVRERQHRSRHGRTAPTTCSRRWSSAPGATSCSRRRDGEDAILTALLEAQPGDDILLTAGTYHDHPRRSR